MLIHDESYYPTIPTIPYNESEYEIIPSHNSEQIRLIPHQTVPQAVAASSQELQGNSSKVVWKI